MSEFLNKNEFTNALPQGDTFLDINQTEIKEISIPNDDGTVRTGYEAKTSTGACFLLPKSVLASIKKIAATGVTKVRITRVGTTKTDTKYTVIAQ